MCSSKPRTMKYEFKGTPGPWRWELNMKHRQLQLCGGACPFDLIVMDFKRFGMQGAAPRFNIELRTNFNVMERAEKFAMIAPDREHHKSWFQLLNHPDANLIEAAPVLLDAAIEFVKSNEGLFLFDSPKYVQLKNAIELALGKNKITDNKTANNV